MSRSEDTDCRLVLLLLDHGHHLLGGLFGDILVVSQPADFGTWRAREEGVNADLRTLLDAQTRLHACVEGDLWFFC